MTLIASFLCMMMLLALGGALTVTTAVETQAAAAAEIGREALHAAEATAERALSDLALLPDWADALDGSVRSSFVDGPGSGTRQIADVVIDLAVLTAEQNAWRSDDGVWRLFAHAPLDALLPDMAVSSRMYGVAWIAADTQRPGAVTLSAHAYGPGGVRRMVELSFDRAPQHAVRLFAWREHRQ